QLFAQVTNPPIDSIREAIVMSVRASVGSERNLLDETPEHARQVVIDNPILLDRELEQLRMVDSPAFKSWTVDTTWPGAEGPDGLEREVDGICDEASVALAAGANILILSDRSAGPARVPLPSLLATGAVHHHLVREGTRLQAGIVVESGEPRSVHSIATLVRSRGRGARPRGVFRRGLPRCHPVRDARDARRAARARLAAGGYDRRAGTGARGQGDYEGP